FRPGARHFLARAFPDAWPRHPWRSAARELSALERSAAGEAWRKRARLPAHGAYAGRATLAVDRKSSVARLAKRACQRCRGTVGCDRALSARTHVLMPCMSLERRKTDVLILGSGGAGLFAALHALKANPDLDVTIASKGLLGKCGCTRMVQ